MSSLSAITAVELLPHLLYRTAAGEAIFASWRLEDGPEALALFTATDAADQFRHGLSDPGDWHLFQPGRDKLITIFEASLAAGIRIAVLNPLDGSARALFDLAQVVASATQQAADKTTAP